MVYPNGSQIRYGQTDIRPRGKQTRGLSQFLPQYRTGHLTGPHLQLFQPLDTAHGFHILFDPLHIAVHPLQRVLIRPAAFHQSDASLQDCDRISQVVGKGRIEPFSFLRLMPQLPVRF